MTALLMSDNAPPATFHYDGLGRRDYQYLLNGASATYARDPLDRLTQFAVIVAPPNNFTLDFTRNPAGGIATNTRDNAAYAWAGHYAVNRAYTTDGLNRYSAISSLTPNPAYDANGNLTSAGGATYTYDIENRLVAATGGVTLTYDPLGRLSQIATSGGATRRFGYDGDALIDEFDGAGNVRRVYVHGPGVDEPMFWWDIPASTWGTLQADERGSIVAVVNNGGAAATINRYDEYGIPAASNAGAFQYTGQVWLPELGMYYYKARVYSSTLGRFLQTDPVGYDDQFNLYAYVGNDPVNASDPSGEAQMPSCGSRIPGNVAASCSGGSILDRIEFMAADDQGGSSSSARNDRGGGGSTGMDNRQSQTGAPQPTGEAPFYFDGERYRPDPLWRRPWYADYAEAAFVLGPPAAAAVVAVAPGAAAFAIARREIVIGGVRLAPFGNRTLNTLGRRPHYHRRGPGGIGRHRPWERRPGDRSWRDRF